MAAAGRVARAKPSARLPLVVGGSGLYLAALLDGYAFGPAPRPEHRRRLHEELATAGITVLADRLRVVDPSGAGRIDLRNHRKIAVIDGRIVELGSHDELVQQNLAEVGKVVTRDMAMVGVGILAGCDAMIPGFLLHWDLPDLVKAMGGDPMTAFGLPGVPSQAAIDRPLSSYEALVCVEAEPPAARCRRRYADEQRPAGRP